MFTAIKSLRSWLLQNSFKSKQGKFSLLLLFASSCICAQVNFVGNPSFETYVNCSLGPFQLYKANYWCSIDSTNSICGGFYFNSCSPGIGSTSTPSNAYSFQYPRTGNGYIMAQIFCDPSACSYPYYRNYPKGRLKSNLIAGKTYCAKMYVNAVNKCQYGIDALQMYFSDGSVDTIQTCGIPLTYLIPQITNILGNVIGDTLNWIEVSGTFTANGTEKYVVIGNFISDGALTKTIINSTYPMWSGYNFDDISVIDFNLSAYAGPDQNISLGDSAFIGRPPEVGLECTWTTGTTSVGTGGGIWVKPTSTGTFSYVVTQNICGNIKTDTVNVNISLGINENVAFGQSINLYPQPSKNILNISLSNYYEQTIKIRVSDVNGKEIRSSELLVQNGKALVETEELSNGVYIVQFQNGNKQITQKKLVISH
jgi:hypothetical protein